MKKQTFTLVEILAVIAIIAILAGMLLPAISASVDRAKEKDAASRAKQLAMAISKYEAEYHVLPYTTAAVDQELGSSEYDTMINYLANTNGSFNARKISFLEVANQTIGFVDPWGAKFKVALDLDYSGSINSSAVSASSVPVNSSSAVWTTIGTKTLKSWKD